MFVILVSLLAFGCGDAYVSDEKLEDEVLQPRTEAGQATYEASSAEWRSAVDGPESFDEAECTARTVKPDDGSDRVFDCSTSDSARIRPEDPPGSAYAVDRFVVTVRPDGCWDAEADLEVMYIERLSTCETLRPEQMYPGLP